MKSHRKHAPDSLDDLPKCTHKGFPNGKVYPKGRKQRIDELKAAERNYWFWFEVRERGRASAAICKYKDQGHQTVWGKCWHGDEDSWSFKRAEKEYNKLWRQAIIDKIIE